MAGLSALGGLGGLLLKKAVGSAPGQTSVGHAYDGGAVGHDHGEEAVGRAANAARVLVKDAVRNFGHAHVGRAPGHTSVGQAAGQVKSSFS